MKPHRVQRLFSDRARRKRSFRPQVEQLEARLALAFSEFIDPNSAAGNQFGHSVVPLSTGNVVITAPFDDAGGTDAGAVYLFNGATGALISTLTGSTASDNVGLEGVVALTNGNFVVTSRSWDLDATHTNVGAVTFGNGNTGVAGVVSGTNSLIGSTSNDMSNGGGTVTALTNGNYVVASNRWDLDATHADVGAVTFGDGTTGVTGAISASNSLIGSTNFDVVGSGGVTALTNDNYVVRSPIWNIPGGTVEVGAVTFGDGMTGITGPVTLANSLTGSRTSDRVGSDGVTALPNGNYLVRSSDWDADATHTDVGAVSFADGDSGLMGAVSAANSLVGSTTGDSVGIQANGGITVLTNGNYVVGSGFWSLDATHTQVGAVTLGDAMTGVVGPISASNSLVGSTSDDFVGSAGVVALTNDNYVVISNVWDLDATHTNVGAITFGHGTMGVEGSVSAANSLVGSTTEDALGFGGNGRVIALTNGNYVVSAPNWDLDATHTDVGAVTFGNGMSGVNGAVSSSNSFVGATSGDRVGSSLVALTNGKFVIGSPNWDLDATHTDVGAATLANGAAAILGTVSAANSLIGVRTNDRVGNSGITALSNDNYVVSSSSWDLDASTTDSGAVTFGDGTTGVVGMVSTGNSVTGTKTNDAVGSGGVQALTNGNYVIRSPLWDLNAGTLNVGAVTFGDGTTGTTGTVSSSNSLVGGTASDQVGNGGVTALDNGNFVVVSTLWDNGGLMNAGAVSFGSGASGVSGVITTSNSALGLSANASLQPVVIDDVNDRVFARFRADGGGRVIVGSQFNGFTPTPDKLGIRRGNHFFLDANGNGQWNTYAGGDRQHAFGGQADVPVSGDWDGDGFSEIGIYRGNQFYLDLNDNGTWDGSGTDGLRTFFTAGLPVTGDWDGDGDDQIGVFQAGVYHLDLNSNGVWDGPLGGDLQSAFGLATDLPVAGDWDGDSQDEIGARRGNQFLLDANGDGISNAGDFLYTFGLASDTPVTGDWDGNGRDKIGVLRNGTFYLDGNGNGVFGSAAGGDLQQSFGNTGDQPVIGLWQPLPPVPGVVDTDRVGVRDMATFFLDANGNGALNTTPGIDRQDTYGVASDVGISGDWNGDGFDEIGVHRGNQFWLDANGNGVWDGVAGGDRFHTFRNVGDVPVVGDWDGDGDDDLGTWNGGFFYLDFNGNNVWNGAAAGDRRYSYGLSTDTPLAGDWNGDGDDDVGVQRGFTFYLDASGNGVWNGQIGGDLEHAFGLATDTPVDGDWNGDGTDEIGTRRGDAFYLDRNRDGVWNGANGGDIEYHYGDAGDQPLVGKWRPVGALLAAGGEAASSGDAAPLTADALAPIFQQAIILWADTGLNAAQLQTLSSVHIGIADLPGAQLGQSLGGTILLDRDAAGYGWYVNLESEISNPKSEIRDSQSMDLLSVVLHELGHELGLDHDDDIEAMYETLALGTRRLL